MVLLTFGNGFEAVLLPRVDDIVRTMYALGIFLSPHPTHITCFLPQLLCWRKDVLLGRFSPLWHDKRSKSLELQVQYILYRNKASKVCVKRIKSSRINLSHGLTTVLKYATLKFINYFFSSIFLCFTFRVIGLCQYILLISHCHLILGISYRYWDQNVAPSHDSSHP
jgi:hypothetical protein